MIICPDFGVTFDHYKSTDSRGAGCTKMIKHNNRLSSCEPNFDHYKSTDSREGGVIKNYNLYRFWITINRLILGGAG